MFWGLAPSYKAKFQSEIQEWGYSTADDITKFCDAWICSDPYDYPLTIMYSDPGIDLDT